MREKDGGSAFPMMEHGEVLQDDVYVEKWWPAGGMSLRDYFAGQALAGGIQEFFTAGETWGGHEDFARTCFNMADAMLKAREAK